MSFGLGVALPFSAAWGVSGPVVCSYALNDDGTFAASMSLLHAGPAVNGQTMSFTAAADGIHMLAPSSPSTTGALAKPSSATAVEAKYVAGNVNWVGLGIFLYDSGGNLINGGYANSTAVGAVISVEIAADGTIAFRVNNAAATPNWLTPGATSLGATDKFALVLLADANIGESAEVTLRTAAADYTATYYTQHYDLCGGALAVTAQPAPANPTATVLSDGVTLRIAADQPITTGSATTGLTRSTGSITSGVISGGYVDLTIPKVYQGEDAGTISYTPGTLAGAGGAMAAFGPLTITNNSTQTWTPADISGIVDYGVWNDLSKLKQPDGTTAVANVGDVVGRWIGQLGQITLANSTTGNCPDYQSSGIRFANGANRWLVGDSFGNRPYKTTMTWALGQVTGSINRYAAITGGTSTSPNTADSGITGYPGSTDFSTAYSANAAFGFASDTSRVNGSLRTVVTYNAANDTPKLWKNGSVASLTLSARNTGSNAAYPIIHHNSSGVTATAKCWVYTAAVLSDADYARLDAWMQGL